MDERPHTAAAGLAHLLGQLAKPGTPWLDKVQLFGALGEALAGPGSSPHPEAAANAERLAACLLDGIGEGGGHGMGSGPGSGFTEAASTAFFPSGQAAAPGLERYWSSSHLLHCTLMTPSHRQPLSRAR